MGKWHKKKKKDLFMLFGFFFSCGEKGQVEDEEKYVYGCLDKGETIGRGRIWCDEIFKDGSYQKYLDCMQRFPYTVFKLQEETLIRRSLMICRSLKSRCLFK